MPTYDYACDKCDNAFEEQHTIANRRVPEGKCIECNDGNVRQVIKAPLFAYDNIASKGHPKKPPGWYSDKIADMKKNIPGNTL